MRRLTEKEYWDLKYKRALSNVRQSSLNFFLERIFGKKIVEYSLSYPDYILWEHIYKKYLPKRNDIKILEVGSAPGRYLIKFNKEFGFIPYGVEYSHAGAELNKDMLIRRGLNPGNIIETDFFSDEFQAGYKGFFDVVFSSGFIEHFDTPQDAVKGHLNLLSKGGYLIISIPNLRGIYYILNKIFNKHILPGHNLGIMRKEEFLKLFDEKGLSVLYCDYYGVFYYYAKIFFNAFQRILNIIFRVFFKDNGAQSRFFSPFLLYIGIKK